MMTIILIIHLRSFKNDPALKEAGFLFDKACSIRHGFLKLEGCIHNQTISPCYQ